MHGILYTYKYVFIVNLSFANTYLINLDYKYKYGESLSGNQETVWLKVLVATTRLSSKTVLTHYNHNMPQSLVGLSQHIVLLCVQVEEC